MAKHGIKFAVAKTMNNAAFDARKGAISDIQRKFINRNTWSKRSVRVNKGNTRNLRASVGSTEEYMRKQEFGGSEKASGRRGVAIPTSYASGEGWRTVDPSADLPRKA